MGITEHVLKTFGKLPGTLAACGGWNSKHHRISCAGHLSCVLLQ